MDNQNFKNEPTKALTLSKKYINFQLNSNLKKNFNFELIKYEFYIVNLKKKCERELIFFIDKILNQKF